MSKAPPRAGSRRPCRRRASSAPALCIAAAILTGSPDGASAQSIRISITFPDPPRAVIRAPAIAPAALVRCKRRQAIIDSQWENRPSKPRLSCTSPRDRPLLVSEGDDLSRPIVHP